jgi:hypothetical protein
VRAGGAALTLAALAGWVAAGSRFALRETAKAIDATSSPRLAAPWFSLIYWRVAGIGVLLTLPFLFAAAVQGLLRSDPGLLVRCALGYLPLAMLGVGVAAQVGGLLLTATDELCALVSSAAGHAGPGFLDRAALLGGVAALTKATPFVVFFVAVLTVAGAAVLWMELVVRDAAVYVVVALLPLAFCAMVWPARRVWALRAIELLVALILSKLAIVAVLTLGGAALGSGPLAYMAGVALVALGACAPWAMVRLIPFAELASEAAGRLRAETGGARLAQSVALGTGELAHNWASSTTAEMRREAERGGVDAGTAPPQLARPARDGSATDESVPDPPSGTLRGGGDVAMDDPGPGREHAEVVAPTAVTTTMTAGPGAEATTMSPEPAAAAPDRQLAPSPDEGAVGENLEPWLQRTEFDRSVFHLGPEFEYFPGVTPEGLEDEGAPALQEPEEGPS